jgi:hypothetical protein
MANGSMHCLAARMQKSRHGEETIRSDDSSQCRDWYCFAACASNAPDIPVGYQRELEPVEPDEPEVPEEPVPPDAPEDFDEPLPDMPDEDVPLEPELWSPARRSQPANAMESAATTNRTCDVLTSGFIVVPFIKMNDVSFLTFAVVRSSSLFANGSSCLVTVYVLRWRAKMN